MIDLHCHILPGLDDGPATLDDAVAMARGAVADGIKTLVATPHVFDGRYEVQAGPRDAALAALRRRLAEEGIALEVLPGSDCHLHEHLVEMLQQSPDHSLNRAGRGFLVEWPEALVPAGFDAFLFRAEIANLTPVLTHPERHPEIQARPDRLDGFIAQGLQLQITAGSLLGLFGRRAQSTARTLLAKGWVHVLASDAHDPETRAPRLSAARREAERLLGPAAVDLVTRHPAALLGIET